MNVVAIVVAAATPIAPPICWLVLISPEAIPASAQQMSPELASRLHDATALSPTNLMPLTLRAKYVMVVQSAVALALFALVVVRAVNALT